MIARVLMLDFVLLWSAALPVWSESAADAPPAHAVVLELFTSQGCSSCPPADRLLSALSSMPELQGQLIPLAYHVDYWNRLGWQDPFSQPRWSERQRRYTRAGWSGRIYTPQMVIQGRSECVGSDRSQVLAAIAQARALAPAARLELTASWPGARSPDQLSVRLQARMLRDLDGARLSAWVAVYESGLTTEVRSGENARRTLNNDYVVRGLEPLFEIEPRSGAEQGITKRLAVAPDWNRRKLGVAAFLQDPDRLQIHAAAASPVAAP